jgi:hypothetical protein
MEDRALVTITFGGLMEDHNQQMRLRKPRKQEIKVKRVNSTKTLSSAWFTEAKRMKWFRRLLSTMLSAAEMAGRVLIKNGVALSRNPVLDCPGSTTYHL